MLQSGKNKIQAIKMFLITTCRQCSKFNVNNCDTKKWKWGIVAKQNFIGVKKYIFHEFCCFLLIFSFPFFENFSNMVLQNYI